MSDPKAMAQTMIDNMAARTGRALPAWLALTVPLKADKHGQILKWLKTEHGVSHGFANLIAHETLSARSGAPGVMASSENAAADDLLTAQYAGAKADLRPVHDAIVSAIGTFGDDIECAPKKTYVSLRRAKQFGLIQPSTKTRVDLGINLKGVEATSRLETSGSFNAMVSHRVRLASVADVDAELIGWLRAAYDSAG